MQGLQVRGQGLDLTPSPAPDISHDIEHRSAQRRVLTRPHQRHPHSGVDVGGEIFERERNLIEDRAGLGVRSWCGSGRDGASQESLYKANLGEED